MKFKNNDGDREITLKAQHGDKLSVFNTFDGGIPGDDLLFVITEKNSMSSSAFITRKKAVKLAKAILKEYGE